MPNSPSRRGFEIAPFRGLRYAGATPEQARANTAPPYDVLSPDEHRRLLEASPHNITHLTLGSTPGEASSYEARGKLLDSWIQAGVLKREEDPAFYVNVIDYPVPGSPERRARFVGLIALGKLHAFSEGVVLPHERTFPKVVDDRLRLLEATRTNLENIFLLYTDPEGSIDRILESQVRGAPLVRVEAKPGEFHELHAVTDVAVFVQLMEAFRRQRPIIADGHHRYTTSLRFATEARERGQVIPGAEWQMMTFGNLRGAGLSILATHRLVKLAKGQDVDSVVSRLLVKLEPARSGEPFDLTVETRGKKTPVRFPSALREARKGVARTSYALLHDVVLADWLHGSADEKEIKYFKEATGENEALARGDGDILFRMRPVDPVEFSEVVQGGEVFPHKTTYFYPKLWSGLVLWQIAEPERLALK